jgi:hypothetical protein
MRRALQRPAIVILLLWAAVTALDLHKAFHVDDTFYLKAGQWIEQHPARPMSGLVNWGSSFLPIHTANQPPGFFYLVALTGHLFGYSEVPMHAMRSLFTLLALSCFHGIARRTTPGQALWLTALFALCPAFLVNQGLMTDIPLLALILLFIQQLLLATDRRVGMHLLFAALAVSAAMFTKYTAAPLLLLFPMVLVLRKQWRWLPLSLLPLVLIAAWSVWNLHEYNGMHLFDRKVPAPAFRDVLARGAAFITCIGAVAPFTPAMLRAMPIGSLPRLFRAWTALLLVGAAFVVAVFFGIIPEHFSDQVLRALFAANGALLLVLCASAMPRELPPARLNAWIFTLWALGLAAFVVIFSPMMASRHVLLVIPPVLLLLAPAWAQAGRRVKMLAVACTGVLGVLLAVADVQYAAFYRTMAPRIAQELPHKGKVWSLGHWGWQWYSEQAGMAIYDADTSAVATGDILVIPADIDRQLPSPTLVLEPLANWTEPPGLANFFCVEDFASMYTSGYSKLPWTLSLSHYKTITAYRVAAIRPEQQGTAVAPSLPWESGHRGPGNP